MSRGTAASWGDEEWTLRAKNALLPETRKMDFRIGINLGDVIEEGDSIYGFGVNIAVRLEGLAARPAGSVFRGAPTIPKPRILAV